MVEERTGTKNRPRGKRGGSSKKITNGLVALSSAAVLTVYTAGYLRTQSAAELFAEDRLPPRVAGAGETASPIEAPAQSVAGGELVARSESAVTFSPPQPIAPPAVPETDDRLSVARAPSTTPEPPAAVPTAVPAPAPAEVATAPPSEPAPPSETPASEAATPAPPEAAPAPAGSAAAPAATPKSQYKDGTYSGWGRSRHGDIEAAVVVQDGRVVSAEITQCLTLYSCSVIATLPSQVISRQNAYVDLISGATVSADAFANAIFRALRASQK